MAMNGYRSFAKFEDWNIYIKETLVIIFEEVLCCIEAPISITLIHLNIVACQFIRAEKLFNWNQIW